MAELINFLSGIIPFWVLKIFMPKKFSVYGHLVSDRGHLVSKYYKYPSLQEFDDFVKWVESLGYAFVDLETYLKDDNKKKVLLTFDDGFKVMYDEFHPYFRARKIPYVLFILTDPLADPDFYIKTVRPDPSSPPQGRTFLSVEEVLELKEQGVHIGFHTRSHLPVKTDDPLSEALKTQLTIPGEYENLFSHPLCFAYPYVAPKNYSLYNQFMREHLNYKFFFDTRGFNLHETDHFYRAGIDAEKGTGKRHWMKFIIKRQLIIFILRQTVLRWRKKSSL